MLRIGILIILIFLNACSGPSVRVTEMTSPVARGSSEPEDTALHDPFSIAISEEYHDGRFLYVIGTLRSSINFQRDDLAIRLRSYADGKEVSSTIKNVSELFGKDSQFQKGDQKEFLISTRAPDITDYQVELLWGNEAERVLPSPKKTRQKILEIRNMSVRHKTTTCATGICNVEFELTGSFANVSPNIIKQGVVRVDFEASQNTNLHTDELGKPSGEIISTGELNLAPGAEKKFKIAIEREFPESQAKLYRPVLKISSVSSKEMV